MKKNIKTEVSFSSEREELLQDRLRWSPERNKTNKAETKSRKTLYVISLIFLSLALITCSGLIYYQHREYVDLRTEFDSVVSTKDKIYQKYEDCYYDYTVLKEKYDDLSTDNKFFKKYAVCVFDSNSLFSLYYHKPSCTYFNDSKLKIYHIDLAKQYGYKPCPSCIYD